MSEEPGRVPGAPWSRLLDDDTLESLVRGDEVAERHASLAAFAHAVRAVGDRPPPEPSPALRARLDGNAGGAPVRRRGLRVAKAASVGLTAKVALATSVAAAAMGGAGAAGVLPREANRVVRDVIEAVTPIEIDRGTGDGSPVDPHGPADATTNGSEDPGAPRAPGTTPSPDAAGSGDVGSADDQPASGGRAGEIPAATAPGQSTGATGATPPGPADPGLPLTPPSTTPSTTVPPTPPSTHPPSQTGTSATTDGVPGL